MAESALSRAGNLLGAGGLDTSVTVHPGVFSMSLRLPIYRASTLAAMADKAGISRNEMTNLVIQAGIDAILETLPPDEHAGVLSDAEEHIVDFIS